MSTKAPAPLVKQCPEWFAYASCKGKEVRLWFSEVHVTNESKAATRRAKDVCFSCPVRLDCLEWANANGELYGVWGGLTPRERGLKTRR